MTEIYAPIELENISDVAESCEFRGCESPQERIDRLMALNPELKGRHTLTSRDTLIIGDLKPGDKAFAMQKKYGFAQLKPEVREVMRDSGHPDLMGLIMCVEDALAKECDSTLLGDTNTLLGGYGAGVAAHHDGLARAMKRVEDALHSYAKAPTSSKYLAKIEVKNAYADMNKRFGALIERRVPRAFLGDAQPVIHSPNRAMKLVNSGMRAPISRSPVNRPIYKTARNIKYMGRGLIGLDLGFRVHSVYRSDNRWRQAAMETGGFVLTMGLGWSLAALGIHLLLGPLGWFLLIGVGAAAAIQLDRLGKGVGGWMYDAY